MAEIEPKSGSHTPARAPRAGRFASLAERQQLACLALAGRREALEAHLRSLRDRDNDAVGRYHLALALAQETRVREALGILRPLIATKPANARARKLAYRLLIHEVECAARAGEWATVSQLISEAMEVSPEGVDAATDLNRFKHVLPLAHLRAGRRGEASRVWEEQLRANPSDLRLLHNLALLHYWWARGLDGRPENPKAPLLAAIAYWTALVHSDGFWSNWSQNRQQVWGFQLPSDELEALRSSFLDEHLERWLQSKVDEAKRNKSQTLAQTYEDCLTAAVLERVSASAWRKALGLLPTGKSPRGILSLPGGVLFFQRFRLLDELHRRSGDVPESAGAECAAQLRIYFSSAGLGTAAVLIQEQNRPDEGLRHLNALPEPARSSVEAAYLRAVGLDRKAALFVSQKKIIQALETWKLAHAEAREGKKKAAKSASFDALFKALERSISEQLIRETQKEAGRLRKAERLDQAIGLLEKALELPLAPEASASLFEYLCIYLCDRGDSKTRAEDFSNARADFNRVLKLQPGHARAKSGLATLLNNLGCREQNHDKAIAMFEEAMRLTPGNRTFEKNLAVELNEKAFAMFKGFTPPVTTGEVNRCIALLERAVKLPCFSLKPEALGVIRAAAEADMEEALYRSIDDEDLLPILKNLVALYQIRRRIQRGF